MYVLKLTRFVSSMYSHKDDLVRVVYFINIHAADLLKTNAKRNCNILSRKIDCLLEHATPVSVHVHFTYFLHRLSCKELIYMQLLAAAHNNNNNNNNNKHMCVP